MDVGDYTSAAMGEGRGGSSEAPRAPAGRVERALVVLSWSYLVGLIAFALALVLVGEDWWGGIVVLYLPRLPLALPLVVLAPLARWRARRAMLSVHAAIAIAIVLVLAGPHVTLRAPPDNGPGIRVLSYNVWYGKRGADVIAREVEAQKADVILLQAMRGVVADHVKPRWEPAYSLHVTTEFLLASRYPIVSVDSRPEHAFIRYTLDTPLGLLDVFNVHPPSPRPGLDEVRHQSKRQLLTDGPSEESVETVERNTDARETDVRELARVASTATHPVLIAGDTNLPEWSRIYRRYLARYQDGFAAVGNGFGYTFPANRARPWMRIDRILSGPELRFTSFHVGSREGSDHCAVWADVEKW